MTADSFATFCHGVQALRRRVERLRSPVGGALGVRAQVFPHQVANVHRILTASRIRHLLADEVGLGKTVQALMVINALGLQRGLRGFRVLVLVPDSLKEQWLEELTARGHRAPVEHAPGEGDERFIRLAWESQLTSSTEIDPAAYELLVVDELHTLKSEFQERIVQQAPEFAGVLVLTATPRLQEERRHAQLLQILEPARAALAAAGAGPENKPHGWIMRALEERERRASELADARGGEGWDALGGAPPADRREHHAALAHCIHRRVIRTRRDDWAGLLPQRVHIPIVVEPTEGEAERQRIIWRYIGRLGKLERDVDPERLAVRALIGGETLRLRIVQLRQQGSDPDGLLAEAATLLGADHGDSRLDALIELLMKIWRRDPTERVLVAAQDNATIDYLHGWVTRRLPEVGRRGRRASLGVACARAFASTGVGLADKGELRANVSRFASGDAQLLLAANVAREGLNLQCSRVLVLYGVPWNPQEIEQWIGRLDRIGNDAAMEGARHGRGVDVYTIVQRDQVDERVVDVLRAYGVFDQGVNLDSDHINEIRGKIHDTGLHPESGAWSALRQDARDLGALDREQELDSPLGGALPWTPAAARSLHEQIVAPAAQEPSFAATAAGRSSASAQERALEAWLRRLAADGEYEICRDRDAVEPDSWFSTLWYRFEFSTRRPAPVTSRVTLGDAVEAEPHKDDRPENRAAYLTRRADIRQPPRTHVILKPRRDFRVLQYCNHGGRLHEALVDGWERFVRAQTPDSMGVTLGPEHRFFHEESEGLFAILVGWSDAAELLGPLKREEIAAAATESTAAALKRILDGVMRQVNAAREADERWIRALLPTQLLVVGARLDGGAMTLLSQNASHDLLRLFSEDKAYACADAWRASPPLMEAVVEASVALHLHAGDMAGAAWSGARKRLREEEIQRRFLCGVERHDIDVLRALECGRAERRAAGRSTPQLRYVQDVASATAAAGDARLAWLDGVVERAASPTVRLYHTMLLRVARGD